MTDPFAIEVNNLFFAYDKQNILENISLSVQHGEFLGIFGPNGGGKTTFLKLLMGFLKPQEGKILLFQKPPKEMREKIGYVPQIARLDKEFPITVFELVLMGCLSKANFFGSFPAKLKRKAEEMLRLVGIEEKKNCSFGSLSGGQAQRALIARALIGDPEILLLDEPTASIDPKAEREIMDLLLHLKGKITILMVTHDLQAISKEVGKAICIHHTLQTFSQEEICSHFALGLYHPPLIKHSSVKGKNSL